MSNHGITALRAAFVACSGLFSALAVASPMSFVVSGNGDISLGSHYYINTDFSITTISDTSLIHSGGAGVYFAPSTSAVLWISGIGEFNFTDQIENFDNQNLNFGGVSDASANLLIADIQNSDFKTYKLSTAIGPLTGPVNYNQGYFPTVNTAAGPLYFTWLNSESFQAYDYVVPEPTPSAMLAAGLGLVFCRRRRRV